MKFFDLNELAVSTRDVLEQDREGEESLKRGEHDIHADDTEVVEEEDKIDEEKQDGVAKFWMRGPIAVTELEARIIQGRKHEFVVNMTDVRAATSPLTNMQILNEEHAKEIYARLLTKRTISSLTLRPISYYDVHLGEVMDFKVTGGRDQFFEVLQNWPEGNIDEEK